SLAALPKNAELFEFFIEKERAQFALELKASRDAAELMGAIYDELRRGEKREPPNMDRLLVRLLFCMFAEDTGIFPRQMFHGYMEEHTRPDGTDFGVILSELFRVLDMRENERSERMPARLRAFPYVNGRLFEDADAPHYFDAESRTAVLDACQFDWKNISPDIFGSLFQTVRDSEERRKFGAHYTSEENIMKVIRPLFLDGMERELNRAGKDEKKLRAFHDKIANLRFLDPACGCGNFLIIAYRELRRLEMAVLLRLGIPEDADAKIVRVSIEQFYGIESDPFPAGIARTAMWLVNDQMNREFREAGGPKIPSIPLLKEATIKTRNALELDWAKCITAPERMSYIFGNPPFVGRQFRKEKQRADMDLVFGDAPGAGNLDYVAAWYMKAARYIRGAKIKCAFVSTNSITQGEQVAALWKLLAEENIRIHFAHRSFVWNNEAGNSAAVSVVIIGFAAFGARRKKIYDYDDDGKPRPIAAKNINGYLSDAPDILVEPRATPFGDAPPIVFGSMPNDDGNLLLTDKEKQEFLRRSPKAEPYIRPAAGAQEFLEGERRWCLWLEGVAPSEFRGIFAIRKRVAAVKKHRAKSERAATQELAKTPHLFGEIRQPKNRYILVPLNTSQGREYIPIGFMQPRNVALNSCTIVPNADMYHFGVMTSAMHMAWMRAVGGRLGTGYRYSNKMVYNTFPWPEKMTAAKKAKIEQCAKAVLDARKNNAALNLAKMYSDMPRDLAAVHRVLDRAVDRAYRVASFAGEGARLEFLFSEYNRLTADLGRAKGGGQ
ncbi:MAG: class I SAM-dependent DNA methyltransferase, partial [Gammaproteobacteria bacterium]